MFEYIVIVGLSEEINDFIDDVDAALINGWQCQGGISANTDSSDIEWLYQAMIREVKPG